MIITPLGDKVFGKMIDGFGEKMSPGGIIYQETDLSDRGARARWFEVTHIGPKQIDVQIGNYVLVSHTRWSRGMDVYGTRRIEDFIFHIDTDAMLCVSDDKPI